MTDANDDVVHRITATIARASGHSDAEVSAWLASEDVRVAQSIRARNDRLRTRAGELRADIWKGKL